ncbi:NAD(P)-dependent dehydrogenase (short-subunit alcohol dehydrogenase family) [Caulobacter ginsengisoli]|uniref:NAD(P)-dependent dehydrogenase (Short-subunit alcohol dehydrogenase family) n=1 Tax=Caulobacter ginsengisoli TaxID=400775 RepID=A0ABU0INK1_9CAUL|nr:SDR family NAD(P)-dependent oxidoreductase [Caulobacter ginsengisoli]MDQ0462599.1 NAD(P)-dependent dehydrogenase (short-subunit alcohol dehydrogenase family) [Caulobacter ginsengisoli]
MTSGPAVVVTGASTGIGRACVAKAAAAGAHVFAGVRKQADADSLKAEFGDRVTPLLFDVTDAKAVQAAADTVGKALGGKKLMGLVNNAGVATPGPLLYLSADELRQQFEVNFIGVHTVTQAFTPLLGAEPDRTGPPGRIVMISSVGGENGSPFVGAYSASKHALEGYSQSLRRELMLFGIDVIVVAPGAIATPIWSKGSDDSLLERYANTPFHAAVSRVRDYMLSSGAKGLKPEAVGELVWHCLTDGHPKTRYRIMRNQLTEWTLPRMILGHRGLDRVMASRLGLKPGQR